MKKGKIKCDLVKSEYVALKAVKAYPSFLVAGTGFVDSAEFMNGKRETD